MCWIQLQGTFTESGPHKDDPKAAQLGMKPHLQVMCGPMLRFDTLENGIWHGFAMVVTSAAGSIYEPKPYISWRVGRGETSLEEDMQHKATLNGGSAPSSGIVEGLKIFEYHGISGTNDFWRFKLEVPMGEHEQPVTYSLNVSFTVLHVVSGLIDLEGRTANPILHPWHQTKHALGRSIMQWFQFRS